MILIELYDNDVRLHWPDNEVRLHWPCSMFILFGAKAIIEFDCQNVHKTATYNKEVHNNVKIWLV